MRLLLGYAVPTVLLTVYACTRTVRDVPRTVMISNADVPGDARCIDFTGADAGTQSIEKLCVRPDSQGRGSIVSGVVDDVQCVRVINPGEKMLGYAEPSDIACRSEVELAVRARTFEFLVRPRVDEAEASSAFRTLATELGSEVRIDLFKRSCDRVCRALDGDVRVVISPRSGVTAVRNAAPGECRFSGPISAARPPDATAADAGVAAQSGNGASGTDAGVAAGSGGGEAGTGGGATGDSGAVDERR